MKTYYEYAQNDYDFLIDTIKEDAAWNLVCASSQKVCERFLKHIIDTYFEAKSNEDVESLNEIMKTHSLKKLIRFLESNMDIQIEEDLKTSFNAINGFYFEMSYPGEDSFFATKEDTKLAIETMKQCKIFIDNLILEIEQEKEQSKESDEDKE